MGNDFITKYEQEKLVKQVINNVLADQYFDHINNQLMGLNIEYLDFEITISPSLLFKFYLNNFEVLYDVFFILEKDEHIEVIFTVYDKYNKLIFSAYGLKDECFEKLKNYFNI